LLVVDDLWKAACRPFKLPACALRRKFKYNSPGCLGHLRLRRNRVRWCPRKLRLATGRDAAVGQVVEGRKGEAGVAPLLKLLIETALPVGARGGQVGCFAHPHLVGRPARACLLVRMQSL
jgi:hypothetical protein